MEVMGSNQSCGCRPTPQPQPRQIRGASVTYTTAHGNAGSFTCWVRPGLEAASSWILVRFFSTESQGELHFRSSLRSTARSKGKHRLLTHPGPLHTPGLPVIDALDLSGPFVTAGEPTWVRHCHPKSAVYTPAHSWSWTVFGSDDSFFFFITSILIWIF